MLSVIALFVTDPPTGPRIVWLLWAKSHRPAFYLLVGLLALGPPLTYLASRTPGRHRPALAAAWLIFITLLIYFFPHRITAMLRVIAWQVY